MTGAVCKSVSWAPEDSLTKIKEYYFYDPETGEALEGQAARNQAKIEALGANWRETSQIMRLCKTASPFSPRARVLFELAEKQVLALEDPCLFLIGFQWRYCGGRSERPEELELHTNDECPADDDTSDSSSDESVDDESNERDSNTNFEEAVSEPEFDWELMEPQAECPVVECAATRTALNEVAPQTLASLSAQLTATMTKVMQLAAITEEQEEEDDDCAGSEDWDTCDVPLPSVPVKVEVTTEDLAAWQLIGRHEATRARVAAI
jgi:hypothetical protein